MKAYIIITGAVFGLVTILHIWRMFADGSRMAKDPFFILLTVLTAGLCFWAFRLLRRLSQS